jgi:hypothetical protein
MYWLTDIAQPDKMHHRIYSKRQLDRMDGWLRAGTGAPHLRDAADKIGTSSDVYIEYPCKAKLKTGEIRDLCILTKWAHHPLISWPNIPVQHFLFASQVLKIEPSEYALSLSIRKAMRNAHEVIHKDLVPLMFVVDKENYFHDLGGQDYYIGSNFLRYKNLKGEDVQSISQNIKTHANSKIKDDLTNSIILILFDEM